MGAHIVLLLPEDPDRAARQIRAAMKQKFGVNIGIIISDTHGRPFRLGNIGVAVGLAGVPALIDQRGDHDLFGRELQATVTPLADELAAAAGLISGQADEGQPVVQIRGVKWDESAHTSRDLLRSPEQDLYV
jgi:coenzyme F420-0:L-glutamate ligase/coenzyme F420-1:gamma-L-glutamate ligase